MTNEEILHKAMVKAVANGWRGLPSTSFLEGYGDNMFISGEELLIWRFELWHDALTIGEYYDYEEVRITAIIFNHEFAKALWGEGESKPPKYIRHREGFTMPATGNTVHEVNLDRIEYDITPGGYKYHLQQMVIADDPIKYLGENL